MKNVVLCAIYLYLWYLLISKFSYMDTLQRILPWGLCIYYRATQNYKYPIRTNLAKKKYDKKNTRKKLNAYCDDFSKYF